MAGRANRVALSKKVFRKSGVFVMVRWRCGSWRACVDYGLTEYREDAGIGQ
jgi:hypothetical protein